MVVLTWRRFGFKLCTKATTAVFYLLVVTNLLKLLNQEQLQEYRKSKPVKERMETWKSNKAK